MKYLYVILVIVLLFSCQPLDLKRVVATRTDQIDVEGTSVVAHGTVLDLGSGQISEYGHCWSHNPMPTVDGLHTNFGERLETGAYKSNLHSILPGQTHYVRSYVFDGVEYTYGEQREFTIKAEDMEFYIHELKETEVVGNILVTSYTEKLGAITFSQHGHCWSTTDPPTINDNITAFGKYDHDTVFTSRLNNLNQGIYYIRAYLKEQDNVVYTATVKYESYITISTGQVLNNASNSAVVEGEINSLGALPIVDHGHCWSAINPQPNINTHHNSEGEVLSLGYFKSTMSDLLSGVTYYYRAYAFDGQYYYYGKVKTFVAN